MEEDSQNLLLFLTEKKKSEFKSTGEETEEQLPKKQGNNYKTQLKNKNDRYKIKIYD